LGPHVAPLGLASFTGTTLPPVFANSMFIGQHGSWNRRPHSGYKVIFVPFEGGKPSGVPVDVLTARSAWRWQGALRVADDVGNVIRRQAQGGDNDE
jgi:glucose/arabinose dehydrogenase